MQQTEGRSNVPGEFRDSEERDNEGGAPWKSKWCQDARELELKEKRGQVRNDIFMYEILKT